MNNMVDSDNQDFTNFNEFITLILSKNPNADRKLIQTAFDFSKIAHKSAKRLSGEPYFYHPIRVCKILLDNNISDTATICSALLHDVIEDTENTEKDIRKIFGDEILSIVLGLTKLNKDRFKEGSNFDFDKYNSENVRKMILSFAKDIRILWVKIADRLDNMRTIDALREDKQKRIAKQTLKVYSPLAEKLGLYKIKGELEDLCLFTLNYKMYKFLSKNIQLTKSQRDEKTELLKKNFEKILDENNISGVVLGRAKHFYSIYKKLSKENRSLDTIYDIYGIRVIVNSIEECYTIENIILNNWEIQVDKITNEDRIKDYIKNPKPNGYQSIHMNFKYEGSVVEVQIRTKDMDNFAESGVAKHWKYKSNERDKKLDKKIDWLRQIITWKTDPKNKDQIENVKFDVFKNQIICVTPKGDLIILQEGSTPLDFAYAIHSRVGDHYEKSYVNGNEAILTQTLQSGDIINIITSQKPMVSKQWLSIVKTNQAISKIRQSLGMTSNINTSKPKTKIDIDDSIFGLEKKIEVFGKKAPIKISKCCNPKYGENIVGYYTKDKKLTIHKITCPDRFALNSKFEVKVAWKKNKSVDEVIHIIAKDVPGILVSIMDAFMQKDCYVKEVHSEEKKKNIGITIILDSKYIDNLKNALEEIQSFDDVLDIKVES